MTRFTRLVREQRGVSAVEYVLLLTAILLLVAVGYRALGSDVDVAAKKSKVVLEGGDVSVGNGKGYASNGADNGGGSTANPPGNNGGSTSPPVTPPGQGKYYKNDTPIDIPPEQSEDNRPANKSWLWKHIGRPLAGPFAAENRAGAQLEGVWGVMRFVKHYDNAAGLLFHWLHGDGSAYEIDARQFMTDLPSFNDTVQSQVQNGIANGGTFDSGWKSGSVADNIDSDSKRSSDRQVLDWYYGLNGYQYRVRGTPVVVDGVSYEKVTVDLFKRYNWGNPTGGGHRNDLKALGGLVNIKQNDLAQLNADGVAHDFNVWGRTEMLVPTNGGPPIYLSQTGMPTPTPSPGPSPVPPGK